jgi:hypothetical protein
MAILLLPAGDSGRGEMNALRDFPFIGFHDYRAMISHGTIGSYNLIADNNPGMFKVERVE